MRRRWPIRLADSPETLYPVRVSGFKNLSLVGARKVENPGAAALIIVLIHAAVRRRFALNVNIFDVLTI